MDQKRILFLCGRSSGRSLMAEAFANAEHADVIAAQSAGLSPAPPGDLTAQVMDEVGLGIPPIAPLSVFERIRAGERFDAVITLCSEAETLCPEMPGTPCRMHWPFEDPETPECDEAARLDDARRIRDAVRFTVAALAEDIRASAGPEPSTLSIQTQHL